ncbi:hypothetical protein [Ancylobacter oerskovii]|uniref:Uncharacterized protein n=1 Tax=Ancylobacter oerskovii TaxID=459519 RepID=A0ABW4YVM6_9HYPH|nr:hypothetical protein [Ancylobacter oerskovii]MBS7544314.1 hypothetical protein [Ancylobacter oerskovii]
MLIQTGCALLILYHIKLTFGVLVENTGVRQEAFSAPLGQVAFAAVVSQVCYWARVLRTPLPITCRHVFLGHLISFAGRLSFIFGTALFSFFFMRHVPAMQLLAFDIGFLGRVSLLISILFVLFCYSLELERLGAALQSPP